MLVDTLHSADITEADYDSNINPPSEKSWSVVTFITYLKFRDLLTAHMACSLLDNKPFNHSYMDAALLLKLEFFLPLTVEKFAGPRLQKKTESLNCESRGPVKIGSKRCKGIRVASENHRYKLINMKH